MKTRDETENYYRKTTNTTKSVQIELTAAVRRDGSEFDRQGVLHLLVVFDGVVVAAATVPELASTQDGAVGEVEPEVLRHLTLLTLPATRGDLMARPVQLDQRVGVPAQTDALRNKTW